MMKCTEIDNKIVVIRGGGGGYVELLLNGYKVTLTQDM